MNPLENEPQETTALSAATMAINTRGSHAILPLARAHTALREALTSIIYEAETSTELLLLVYKAERSVALCLEQAGVDSSEYFEERITSLLAEVRSAKSGAPSAGDTEPSPATSEDDPTQPSPD
jgi:hypothetical protein